MITNLRGIVLWSRRSRDADKIVSVFTEELGRVMARATSAARPTAKFAALTEPFVESEIALYRGRGNAWGKMVGGRLIQSFPALRTQIDRATAASWVCEIMYRLTAEEQPSPEKYKLLRSTLQAIETATQFSSLRLAFALRFLDLAGFGIGNRDAWIGMKQAHPDWAELLMEAPLPDLGGSTLMDATISSVERLAGEIVADHLNRPLHVNRFRQMTGVEI